LQFMPHGATSSRFMVMAPDFMVLAFIGLIIAFHTLGLQAAHTFRFYVNYKITSTVPSS
jgi:hypothetical protein